MIAEELKSGTFVAPLTSRLVYFALLIAGCAQPFASIHSLPDLPAIAAPRTSEYTIGPASYSPNEIVVKFKPKGPPEDAEKVIVRMGGRVLRSLGHTAFPGPVLVQVATGEVESAVQNLSQLPEIEYAEPNYIRVASAIPNDTYFSLQWGFRNAGQGTSCHPIGPPGADIGATAAWDITSGSPDVLIAVLDTGIQTDHPDLTGKVAVARSFASGYERDGNGHGTHVSGIAAAWSNNGVGVSSVCWQCRLINAKVLDDGGFGTAASSTAGILWATDAGAKVINMSYSFGIPSVAEQDAVNYAWSHGAVVVAAAGNDSRSQIVYPAGYENVIAVGATNNSDQRAFFSNYGPWVKVAAPGLCIASTYRNGTYYYISGTSQASPMVAGLAGLLFSKYPGMTNAEVRDRIFNTADPIAGTGADWVYGRINAFRALQ